MQNFTVCKMSTRNFLHTLMFKITLFSHPVPPHEKPHSALIGQLSQA